MSLLSPFPRSRRQRESLALSLVLALEVAPDDFLNHPRQGAPVPFRHFLDALFQLWVDLGGDGILFLCVRQLLPWHAGKRTRDCGHNAPYFKTIGLTWYTYIGYTCQLDSRYQSARAGGGNNYRP